MPLPLEAIQGVDFFSAQVDAFSYITNSQIIKVPLTTKSVLFKNHNITIFNSSGVIVVSEC